MPLWAWVLVVITAPQGDPEAHRGAMQPQRYWQSGPGGTG